MSVLSTAHDLMPNYYSEPTDRAPCKHEPRKRRKPLLRPVCTGPMDGKDETCPSYLEPCLSKRFQVQQGISSSVLRRLAHRGNGNGGYKIYIL
ncbi:hypothetical protein PoB_002285700 [Plakobranchus ocellatus]|uniref:Uncharacterized protein n=1 Tax=Plakobranchus ocellatus TaxID=259542 RepID=A0AAV3ZPB5_9GAST|nr:hypothetical protein PoB_002285700 [Plakobranchus ocellatus]